MRSKTQAIYDNCYKQDLFNAVESQIMIHIHHFTVDNLIQRELYLSEPRPCKMLEAIINTAKQMVGFSGYDAEKGFNALVQISLNEGIALVTVEAIAAFLSEFRSQGNTIATDYLHIVKAFISIQALDDQILTGVQSASAIHGSQGEFAYGLLTAAQYLVITAKAVLKNDASYAADKFRVAQDHLNWANFQAEQYDPKHFPKHQEKSNVG